MYVPPVNRVDDWEEIVRFVESTRAADLVTVDSDGIPASTLMPYVWKEFNFAEGNYGKVVMHMAKGNPQWKSIKLDTPGLAIVHGAQAYISPSNYSNKFTDHKVVPTWNYQAVHLTGTVEVSEDLDLLRGIVTELSNLHEYKREEPWPVEDADPQYFNAQLHGIVAVILHVTKVEAKYKLSQNKSHEERTRIVEDLFVQGIAGEDVIAQEMQKRLDN